jgi:hypothetical protein
VDKFKGVGGEMWVWLKSPLWIWKEQNQRQYLTRWRAYRQRGQDLKMIVAKDVTDVMSKIILRNVQDH